MATPLITNDFLSNPIMPGIIGDKTVALIADQGNRLSQDIELRSTTAEAQFKAPQITQLYSSAYQKIVSGDMTGFADMQKARSLAIGNPILMHTLDSADQIAGHLANEWISGKNALERANIQKTSSDDIMTRQAAVQDRIDARQTNTINAAQNREDARAAEMQYRTDTSQWEQTDLLRRREYEAQAKSADAWNKAQDIRKTQYGTDYTPRTIDPYEPLPKPVKRGYSSEGTALPSADTTSGATVGSSDANGLPLDWIKKLEGFNGKPYKDGKQTSIGYGTRATPEDIANNKSITPDEAKARLVSELSTHASRVDDAAKQVGLTLTPTQREALISYDYNTGRGVAAIQSSKGNPDAIANAILNGPVTQNGTVLRGLVNRRKEEANRFLSGGNQDSVTSDISASVGDASSPLFPNAPALPASDLAGIPKATQVSNPLLPASDLSLSPNATPVKQGGLGDAGPPIGDQAMVGAASTFQNAEHVLTPRVPQKDASQPLVNQTSIQFGDAVFHVGDEKKTQPDEMTVDDKGIVTTKDKNSHKKEELLGLLQSFASNEPFAGWASAMSREGHKVFMEPSTLNGKNQMYVAKSGGEVYSKPQPSTKPGEPGRMVPVEFTEKDATDWKQVGKLSGELKGAVKIEFPPPPPEAAARMKANALNRIAQGADPGDIQAGLDRTKTGIQLSEDDIKAAQTRTDTAKQEASTKSEQQRIDEALANRGIRIPAATGESEQAVISQMQSANDEINNLNKQLDAMKGSSDVETARTLQKRLFDVEKKAVEVRKKLLMIQGQNINLMMM